MGAAMLQCIYSAQAGDAVSWHSLCVKKALFFPAQSCDAVSWFSLCEEGIIFHAQAGDAVSWHSLCVRKALFSMPRPVMRCPGNHCV